MQRKISIIVALAENNVIGGENQLLWHISRDLRRFKELTTGHDIIMGRKTYLSLPFRPLPKRKNIVLSRGYFSDSEGCIVVSSIDEALNVMNPDNENFVIGGGEVYKQFLPLAEKLYLTRVHKHFEGDTFFPEISEKEWQLVEDEVLNDDPQNDFTYSFQLYVNRSFLLF
ncbi:MAG: dihydrofolate reductase [Bacteroidales bacterium]|nr:dihydrofolate reductase [Bacteroidales bacterium]